MEHVYTEDDIAQAEQYPNLGAEYFAARRFMERFTKGWEDDHLKPLADTVAKEVCDRIKEKVWDDFRDYLLIDTEYNAQGVIREMVHGSVQALLSGEKWAMERYPLANDYTAQGVRKAIAEHIGDEIAQRRIAELEAEVKRLEERLAYRSGAF